MKKILVLVVAVTTVLTSCTDATTSQLGGFGDKHKVEMYSGGELVRTWIATGKVLSTESSDGYYFRDQACDCNVEVSGDVIITRIKN